MVRFPAAAALTILAACLAFNAEAQNVTSLSPAVDSINRYMAGKAAVKGVIKIDTFFISDKKHEVDIRFRKSISDYPLRDTDLEHIAEIIRPCLPVPARKYSINLKVQNRSLSELSSGFFSGRHHPASVGKSRNTSEQWITDLSTPSHPDRGLNGRHIALWSGHGYYYDSGEDRWKWQRAPYFSTIEDLLPHSYVISFLAPMLENAGATVLMPRERDPQPVEIIVDNGSPFYSERNGNNGKDWWKDAPEPGFAEPEEYLKSGENPFRMGNARMVECNLKSSSSASYFPFFPESGDYSVYVSYQTTGRSAPALYTVRHSGGDTRFTIDQNIGGGTWVYLGTFRFTRGETGQGVIVQNSAPESKGQGTVTTDAVKFGGGSGSIVRGMETSGVPRYAEAARYWMQWSGFPEKVYSLNDCKDDYRDDFMSRGEWVNSLVRDFSIPIDLALALHTDAGAVMKDSIVGTLAIYKEESEGRTRYSDGTPRITSRELSDIVQTSIVEDVRNFYRKDWTRRAIWDRSYMEARVPDVPTVLIELLSHQNFADMQCAMDPQFKFIVSRAIYKGILRYLSYVSGIPCTVQPLPVRNFSALIQKERKDGASVRLQWSPREDPSEPSAVPDAYIVYRRITDPSASGDEPGGFDNGVLVTGTEYTDDIVPGKIYSYKVAAVNSGGISFPSEILSAGYIQGSKEVLAVNGFTSVSAPASMPVSDSVTAGFDFRADHGTPYIRDISYIGEQYEYRRDKEWIHDDRPGFGASYMDYGPAVFAGNTFDYPLTHGTALMRAGVSFSSASLGAVLSMKDAGARLLRYSAIDIFFGKETEGIFTEELRGILSSYCKNGGALLVSGAGIGKASAYEDRTYPETEVLQSAVAGMESSMRQLIGLRDSLGRLAGGQEAASRVSQLISSLDRLSQEAKEELEENISSIRRDIDPVFIANRTADELLHFGWSNASASSSGMVRTIPNPGEISADSTLSVSFRTSPNPHSYCVTSPDAILPSDEKSFTFMRYEGSNTSAGVAYDDEYRSVSLGFPIEALTSQHQVDCLMREVIEFLLR